MPFKMAKDALAVLLEPAGMHKRSSVALEQSLEDKRARLLVEQDWVALLR